MDGLPLSVVLDLPHQPLLLNALSIVPTSYHVILPSKC